MGWGLGVFPLGECSKAYGQCAFESDAFSQWVVPSFEIGGQRLQSSGGFGKEYFSIRSLESMESCPLVDLVIMWMKSTTKV